MGLTEMATGMTFASQSRQYLVPFREESRPTAEDFTPGIQDDGKDYRFEAILYLFWLSLTFSSTRGR